MRLVTFEYHAQAADTGEHRTRWNGGPLASDKASQALSEVEGILRAALAERGFTVAHMGYGVTADDV